MSISVPYKRNAGLTQWALFINHYSEDRRVVRYNKTGILKMHEQSVFFYRRLTVQQPEEPDDKPDPKVSRN